MRMPVGTADLTEAERLVERNEPGLASDPGDIEQVASRIGQPLSSDQPKDRHRQGEPAPTHRPSGFPGPSEGAV